MISISRFFETDGLNKRQYTDKYPGVKIPSVLSKPALKKVIGHLQQVLDQKSEKKVKQ